MSLDWLPGSVVFLRPAWLLLALLLPVIVWASARSLAGLGPWRQSLAIALRGFVLLLVIMALAEARWEETSEGVCVLFLVDRSESMPRGAEEELLRGIRQSMEGEGRDILRDRAGVIAFGGRAAVEIPPTPFFRLAGFETDVPREATDLAAAIQLAQGSFPEDAMRRIVILSDGNGNRGNALKQAQDAKADGVRIDCVPVRYRYEGEVLVEELAVPPEVRKGETIRIVAHVRSSGPAAGKLRFYERRGKVTQLIAEQDVELVRGLNPVYIEQRIDEPDFYTYEAEFQPFEGVPDRMPQNNRAAGYSFSEGEARILLVALPGTGEHDAFVAALRAENIVVDTVQASELPPNLAALQTYHAVILGNVPAEEFAAAQLEMLEAYTRDLGGGLVMLGGPHSFGAGGYNDGPIERALPVEMEIKSQKVVGKGALVLIMHASEMPQGNYWQQVIAKEAIRALSSRDIVGLLHWKTGEAWVIAPREVGDKEELYSRINRMVPGDMPDFDPGLRMAHRALVATDALTKHIIVISDGDPTPPSQQIKDLLRRAKITCTTVGVATHGPAERATLETLASATNGRYYHVPNPQQLPRIYQKEARQISKQLIHEKAGGIVPVRAYSSEAILGLGEGGFPAFTGLILTTAKESPTVQVPLGSPEPKGEARPFPLLAHWQYGLGRGVAFTSDSGAKWTNAWTGWTEYRKFWSQLVRWSMRNVEKGHMTITHVLQDGGLTVRAEILDKQGAFANYAKVGGTLVDPEYQTRSLDLRQVGPGLYEAFVPGVDKFGNYLATISASVPGMETAVVSAGVHVPYSQEYRELRSNVDQLQLIADTAGGKLVEVADLLRGDPGTSPFRRDGLEPVRSYEDLWPLLLFAASLAFLGDVAVRKIALDVEQMRGWGRVAWAYVTGRAIPVRRELETLERLKARKEEEGQARVRDRAATRFEPAPGGESQGASVLESADAAQAAGAAPPLPGSAAASEAGGPQQVERPPEESYTNRLLKAKRRIWDERKPT